jgi:CBS domain-containing protein
MTLDQSLLTRLDSFPYRNRLTDVMARPAVTAGADQSVSDATAIMSRTRVSSVLIVDADGKLAGIVTRGNLIDLFARFGPAAFAMALGGIMSAPVHSVAADDFLYVAIARMDRLGITHLPVVGRDGAPIGMVTARSLLRVRAGNALIIGDDVAQAKTCDDLARARAALPTLAAGLRQDGTPALLVAGIISGVIRDITRRAAEMIEEQLAADGWGPPPVRFALLVLGSAARGESLLAFDQDNALVHAGGGAAEPWFAEFGSRLNKMLDQAGIDLCKGGVMAGNAAWRHSLAEWEGEIRGWVFEPQDKTLLNVDIFFDQEFVHGDRALADELRLAAYRTAAQSNFFLQLLSQKVLRIESPLGAFGRFVTTEGRLDAKKYGLLPLVSTARIKAIQAGISNPATADRIRQLAEAEKFHSDDRDSLLLAHETLLAAILDQQLADIAAGQPPSSRIEPSSLPRAAQSRLRRAFERIKLLKAMAGTLMPV